MSPLTKYQKTVFIGYVINILVCLVFLVVYHGFFIFWNAINQYVLFLILQLQVYIIFNRVTSTAQTTGNDPVTGSLLDPVFLTDISSIEFETTPLSFQQQRIYSMLKTQEFSNPADYYTASLHFLHVRAIDKTIPFRNLPAQNIDHLVEKAYKASGADAVEFENSQDLFSDLK